MSSYSISRSFYETSTLYRVLVFYFFYTILEFSGSGDIIGYWWLEIIYLIGGYEKYICLEDMEAMITKRDLWIRRQRDYIGATA